VSSIPDDDVQTVIESEIAMLQSQVRRAERRLEDLLHPEYFEFGASGRRLSRRETVQTLTGQPSSGRSAIVASEVAGERLAPDVVLVTYVSYEGQRRCWRSSLWRQTDTGWRLYFHQGTPIPPD
jgi:hypothetical protein